jgi:glycosyltransferase involved in cell wall biosynthesis
MPDIQVAHLVPAPFGAVDGIVGGAERYVYELARNMANEVRTTLVTFGGVEKHEYHGDLAIHTIGQPWYVRRQRYNPFSFRLFSALRGATVVHCHQQHVLASSAAAAYARATGRRVFVTDLAGGAWDISAYWSTDSWYHGHLHISEYSRSVYGHQRYARAHVISGGVDAERFSPGPASERGQTVVYVGRLVPHKGVDYLIKGLPEGLALDVIGRSVDELYVNELRALASHKNVTFHQNLEDAALVQAYRRALCVVLPSVYRTSQGQETRVPELLGQTLLEGMACGAPVICTQVGSMPEIVLDEVTGFIVPPNDPVALGERLDWLRNHPGEAQAMGAAGRRRVLEHFSWRDVVRRCIAIYST